MAKKSQADQKLATYRAKRDFKKTAEPSGRQAVAASKRLRYVIQKHAATRLHYDFRLELGGVFKSWAVTREPSWDPRDKRLAVEVEDHPLDYGDFEGTIPKGQYGGGTVMLWDRGFWRPQDAAAEDAEERAQEALKAGNLKIVLQGERLRGSWVLVRMRHDRHGGKRTNWLLIKHREADARTPSSITSPSEDRSVASGRTMEEITAGVGRGPKPFMLATKAVAKADAMWQSNRSSQPAQTAAQSLEAGTAAQVLPGSRTRKKVARLTNSPPAKHAPRTRSAKRFAAPVSVMGVEISKPDKVLWPETRQSESLTKLDLARYFQSVGEWMIPHLRGRPCSVVRFPDGLEGERFFQRHAMRGVSEHFTLTRVAGEKKPFLQLDRIEALIGAAQIAVLELHPWGSTPGKPDIPGRLVFDLDPGPDVPFDAVVDAALEVRARLEKLGLVAFCKTTGGKGLHVVTPLAQPKVRKAAFDWDTARDFAETVCRQMAEDSPERYVVKMAKDLRSGHIYLDYLRNERMASSVAPLSPRGREGAPVSMPLTWSQVRHGLDPKRYTLKSVPKLIAKSTAWQEYCDAGRPLLEAIQKLVQASPAPHRRSGMRAETRLSAAAPLSRAR